MSSEIQIHHGSFGQPQNAADSLILELSNSEVYFCEWMAEQNHPAYIAHYSFEMHQSDVHEQLLQAIRHFQFLKKNYTTVYINYFTPHFTLCPVNFYESSQSRSLLEFNVGPVSDRPIVTDDVTPEIKLIYAVDDLLKSTLDSIFPQHQMKHTLTVLSRLLLQSEELSKEQMLLAIHTNYIEISVKQDHKLILTNQFSVKTQEDVLYYVLFVLEQYQLNPITATLTVTGNIHTHTSLLSTLKKYVKHIRLGTGHKVISWKGLEGMPQHFNYSLLNRSFCES